MKFYKKFRAAAIQTGLQINLDGTKIPCRSINPKDR